MTPLFPNVVGSAVLLGDCVDDSFNYEQKGGYWLRDNPEELKAIRNRYAKVLKIAAAVEA